MDEGLVDELVVRGQAPVLVEATVAAFAHPHVAAVSHSAGAVTPFFGEPCGHVDPAERACIILRLGCVEKEFEDVGETTFLVTLQMPYYT